MLICYREVYQNFLSDRDNPSLVFCFRGQYFIPKLRIAVMIGRRSLPSGLILYSTCNGEWEHTSRVMRPSFSIERRLSVSTLALMPGMFFSNTLKRQVLLNRRRKIRRRHLLPISCTVVVTGHDGNSSLLIIVVYYLPIDCFMFTSISRCYRK